MCVCVCVGVCVFVCVFVCVCVDSVCLCGCVDSVCVCVPVRWSSFNRSLEAIENDTHTRTHFHVVLKGNNEY